MGCSASNRRASLSDKDSHRADGISQYSSPVDSKYSFPATPTSGKTTRVPSLVHHLPSRKGDSHHIVSLKSTSYGYLRDANKEKIIHLSSPRKESIKFELEDCDQGAELAIKGFEKGESNLDGSSKKEEDGNSIKSRPLWNFLSEESLLSSMDPNVALSYRNALSSRQLGGRKELKSTKSLDSSPLPSPIATQITKEDKAVLYFTSLRGIRKTYEDCCGIRMILRGCQVAIDERDVSMDYGFRKELERRLKGEAFKLPQLFVRGSRVGGLDEVKKLNDDGKLGQLFVGFPKKARRSACLGCGDAGFVPCPNCSGSRRVFDPLKGKSRRCLHCNENGLVRCPRCSV